MKLRGPNTTSEYNFAGTPHKNHVNFSSEFRREDILQSIQNKVGNTNYNKIKNNTSSNFTFNNETMGAISDANHLNMLN